MLVVFLSNYGASSEEAVSTAAEQRENTKWTRRRVKVKKLYYRQHSGSQNINRNRNPFIISQNIDRHQGNREEESCSGDGW